MPLEKNREGGGYEKQVRMPETVQLVFHSHWLFSLPMVAFYFTLLGVAPLLVPRTQGREKNGSWREAVLVEAGVGPVGGMVAVRC